MSIWDTPVSEISSEELINEFHWFHEQEGGRGMKDLINHDSVCNELEKRGYEINVYEANQCGVREPEETYCGECDTPYIENDYRSTCECGKKA